uniref:F-box domain-containing protein n=1 Tax=Oryza barthii TaxID=65489 RepID=A0A0D3H4A4_9ORYZ
MATLASRCAAVACRRLSRRLLSSSSTPLLGHFHHPTPVVPVPTKGDPPCPGAPTVVATFHPLTASSPRLSLDFLPDAADFELYDSHLGLLLLHHHNRPFLVCDPVSRRHARFHPPPLLCGRIVGAALLSREAEADDPGDGGLRFEAVRVAVDDDRPRAWVATHRDGVCSWRALPRSRDYLAVRAAGSLYWHICNNACALALDAAALQFSFLRAPAVMWEPSAHHKYRVGEMPVDGRLCVGSLEDEGLQLWVRGSGKGSDHGWVLERHVRMQEVLDAVPWLPRNILLRHANIWLSDIDAGRTGKVFIASFGFGRFSYHLDTGKLECLAMEDGMEYGHPIFPFFSAPNNLHCETEEVIMASETLQTLLPPPPAEEAPTTTVAALTDDTLRNILHRLAPADLLRAALACHRWRRAAARCVTGAPPPLLGYFFHPADTPPPVHLPFSASRGRLHPAAFSPVDASSSSPRLSLDYLGGTKGFIIYDVYLGLGRCVHAAGDIYWHICHSGRLLKLDPATLSFSYLLAPSELGDSNKKFRIGETPEDGRLGMATVEDQEMQFWVRGEASGSDNGWFLRKRMNMRRVLDTIPGLPRDMMSRIISIWLSDIDAGRTGKLFIKTQGYGRYSFHMDTGKLERLATEDGKEYGHPIYAYYVAWPPAFLAPELEPCPVCA